MQKYQKIDLLRLFCAFQVVLIHCLEVKAGHPIAHMLVTCFTGQAVPFFFITSGFFFAKKYDCSQDCGKTVRSFVLHNLMLYGAWMILEFPGVISLYRTMYPDAGAVYLAALIFRRICLAGQGVYWYILVMAEAGVVCGLLLRCKKEKVLYVLAGIGLIMEAAYDCEMAAFGLSYVNRMIYTVFSWSNNVLMKGIPYMTIGIFLARHEAQLRIPKKTLYAAYGLVGAVSMAYFVAANIYRPEGLRYMLHSGVQSVLLFLIAISPTVRKLDDGLCKNAREISACLYYLHTVFIYNVANRFWPVDSPILMRYAIASIPPIVIWYVVRKLDWKPAKWMLSIK